jgi:hypothetical protein
MMSDPFDLSAAEAAAKGWEILEKMEQRAKETPALSCSIAQVLLEESPLHAWTIHRLLGGRPRPTSDSQRAGQLIHKLLLSGGDGVEVIEFDDFKKKDAQAARDLAISKRLTPVVRPKYDEAIEVVARIRDQIAELANEPDLRQLAEWDEGKFERREEWYESGRGGRVLCHGGLDWISPDETLVVDVKTTPGNAHPDICAAQCAKSHTVLQDAAYPRAVWSRRADLVGRVRVLFLFCETTDPWVVTPAYFGGSMGELGAVRWQRAVDLWSECLRDNRWPAYTKGAAILEAPTWAVSREITAEAMGN